MLIVMCSSTGWKFTAIVFPKVYNQIAHLFKEGEIVLVKGKLNCKIEMKEISIEADQVKRSSISDLRTAAQNDGLFGDGDILFPTLQNKYNCILEEKDITIKLPHETTKDTLVEIKDLIGEYSP